jgi:hypothetical protein
MAVAALTARRPGRATAVLAAGALVLLAAATLASVSTLRADPAGWLRWGRELALSGAGPLDTTGLPSWKPLPVIATAPLAFTGDAAPWLWRVLVCAAGLAALAGVASLAAARGGPRAGVVAAALLALTPAFWSSTRGGMIEPVVVALGAGAAWAHVRGRPGLVLGLLAAMALGREEALVLVLAYAVALRTAGPAWPAAGIALALAVAAVWLGGDLYGSGNVLHGGALARGAAPETPVTHFTPLAYAVAAVVVPAAAILIARGLRRADAVTSAIAAAAAAWLAADLGLLALGYPVPARFLLPAASGLAVVAGVGYAAACSAQSR